jgi:outer membrane protein insertion porin family
MNNYNAELRFPILGPFYGVMFFDAGNIWEEFDTWEPADLFYGGGLGLRLKTPIGPFRFDWGYPFNPSDLMESRDMEFYFSIGEAF